MRSYVLLLVVTGVLFVIYSVFLAETQLDKAAASLGALICIVGAQVILGVVDLLKNTKGEDE